MNIESFIWGICDDVLRGLFKQHEYGDVILPFLVLRRLDCVQEEHKDKILKLYNELNDKFDDPSDIIHTKLGINFSNHSKYDLRRLVNEPSKLNENLYEYLSSFSPNVQDIVSNFEVKKFIDKLEKNNFLYIFIEKFSEIDLHPDKVDNHLMGTIFEELLRQFSEMSNETSGEHYTPRDVVNLLVSLVFNGDEDNLKGEGIIRSIFDPMYTCTRVVHERDPSGQPTLYRFRDILRAPAEAVALVVDHAGNVVVHARHKSSHCVDLRCVGHCNTVRDDGLGHATRSYTAPLSHARCPSTHM